MKNLKTVIYAIVAGMLIGLGGTVFIGCADANNYIGKIVGAFLFAVGLFGILNYGFNLYTGKVGYIVNNKPKYLIEVLLTVLGNLIGCILMGLVFNFDTANTMCESKIDVMINSPVLLIGKAICCGILMFIAVDLFKTKGNVLATFICVPVFILAGFEHSVADMFYFASAQMYTLDALLFIIIVVLGNAIGGMLIPFVKKLDKID